MFESKIVVDDSIIKAKISGAVGKDDLDQIMVCMNDLVQTAHSVYGETETPVRFLIDALGLQSVHPAARDVIISSLKINHEILGRIGSVIVSDEMCEVHDIITKLSSVCEMKRFSSIDQAEKWVRK